MQNETIQRKKCSKKKKHKKRKRGSIESNSDEPETKKRKKKKEFRHPTKPKLIAIKHHKQCNLKLSKSSIDDNQLICDVCNKRIDIDEDIYECNGKEYHDYQIHFNCGLKQINIDSKMIT